MATHSTEAASLASLTLTIHLIRTLNAKGLFNDDDYRKMLTTAVDELSRHEDGDAAIAVIREIVEKKES